MGRVQDRSWTRCPPGVSVFLSGSWRRSWGPSVEPGFGPSADTSRPPGGSRTTCSKICERRKICLCPERRWNPLLWRCVRGQVRAGPRSVCQLSLRSLGVGLPRGPEQGSPRWASESLNPSKLRARKEWRGEEQNKPSFWVEPYLESPVSRLARKYRNLESFTVLTENSSYMHREPASVFRVVWTIRTLFRVGKADRASLDTKELTHYCRSHCWSTTLRTVQTGLNPRTHIQAVIPLLFTTEFLHPNEACWSRWSLVVWQLKLWGGNCSTGA